MILTRFAILKSTLFLCLLLLYHGCISLDFTEVRAQFLPPVNYTGSICRLAQPTLQKILTPNIESSDSGLARKMARLLASTSRYYSISIIDPASGFFIRWNDELIFHGASTYKAAILVAVMKMDQEKQISILDTIEVKNRFFSMVDQSPFSLEDDPEKPDAIFSKIGEKVTIQELLHEMITRSSNIATNLLISHFGPNTLNSTLAQMNSPVQIVRGVSDDRAYAECINNTVSAKNLTSLYEIIYNENFFTQKQREKIISVLKDNDDTSRLPAKLPENTIVAHKPGETSKVLHDAGIVIPSGDNTPYYITVLAAEYKPGITKAIAEVSKLAYEAVIKARENTGKNKYNILIF